MSGLLPAAVGAAAGLICAVVDDADNLCKPSEVASRLRSRAKRRATRWKTLRHLVRAPEPTEEEVLTELHQVEQEHAFRAKPLSRVCSYAILMAIGAGAALWMTLHSRRPATAIPNSFSVY